MNMKINRILVKSIEALFILCGSLQLESKSIFSILSKNSLFMNKNQGNEFADGIHHLDYQHVKEVAALLTKSFLKNNQFWSKCPLSKQELDIFFRQVLTEHLHLQERAQQYTDKNFHINMIYILKGKIVSALLHYEIEQYRLKCKLDNNPPSLDFFRRFERYKKQLLKDVDLSSLQKGQHVYGSYGAADDQNIPPKYINLIIFEYCAHLRSKGIKSMISKTSNIKANILFQKLGGKVLKKMQFKENGTIESQFLLFFDFYNPIFNNLLKMRQSTAKTNLICPKL